MRLVGLASFAIALACAGAGGTSADRVVQFGTDRDDMAWAVAAWGDAVVAAGSTDHPFDKVCDKDTRDEEAYVRQFDAATLREGWSIAFGTKSSDTVRAIEADDSGIYVVGTTGGSLDGPFAGGHRDVFVRRLSHDGKVVAGRQIGTRGLDEGLAVALHGGSVWVAGGTTGDLCASHPGPRTTCAAGREDGFVARLDLDLNVLAVAQVGSDRFEEATGLAVDDRWVVVVGGTAGRVGAREVGKTDAWVARLTHDLELREVHQYGSPASDFARDVALWNGDTFVVGRTEGTIPPGADRGRRTDNDAYLYRVPFDGKEPWVVTWGDATGGAASRIVADATGLYTVGSGGMGFVKHECAPVDQRGDVRKWTHAGSLVWEVPIDTPDVEDEAMGLAVSPAGVFVSGKTLGTLGARRVGAYDAWVAYVRDAR
jgi:hypothetical protein